MQSSRSELYLNKTNYLHTPSPTSLMLKSNDIHEVTSDYAHYNDGNATEVSLVTGLDYNQDLEPDTDPTSVILKGL